MVEKTKISSAQIRAARGLLNWSAHQLSLRSGLSQSTILRAESVHGTRGIHEHGLTAIKATLEQCGIEFLDNLEFFAKGRLSSLLQQARRAKFNCTDDMITEELADGSWATGGKRYTYKEKDGQLDSGAQRNSIF